MEIPHQDFTPIVFNKGGVKNKAGAGSRSGDPDGSKTRARKIEQNAEEGNLTIETVSLDLRTKIRDARLAKKLTQRGLAQACNMQENDIKRYENGEAIPNQKDLSVMSRVLGVGLSNKKRR